MDALDMRIYNYNEISKLEMANLKEKSTKKLQSWI